MSDQAAGPILSKILHEPGRSAAQDKSPSNSDNSGGSGSDANSDGSTRPCSSRFGVHEVEMQRRGPTRAAWVVFWNSCMSLLCALSAFITSHFVKLRGPVQVAAKRKKVRAPGLDLHKNPDHEKKTVVDFMQSGP